jgi:hypothetical protein
MRTWVKATLGGVALVVVALVALGGTAAYFVLRHMEKRAGSEAEVVQEIDGLKARFGSRAPLIEIADPQTADIRINRPVEPSSRRVDTIHVVSWKPHPGELSRTEFPLWLMRFSTVNIASQLGIAPAKFRLTVSDVERYGPGIVVDYGAEGSSRVLIWVE